MKILFSSSGKDLDSNLDLRFGRCPYFLIYNTENEEVKVLENAGQNASGGAGIAAAQQVVDENVDVVITSNVGPNAFNLLQESSVEVYKGKNIPCSLLLKNFNEGKLEKLKTAGPSHMGMSK